MDLNKTESAIIFGSFIILVFAFSIVANVALLDKPIVVDAGDVDLSHAFTTTLDVTVRDAGGVVKETRHKDGDLVLSNFGYMIKAILSATSTGGVTVASGMVRTSGGSAAVQMKGGSSSYDCPFGYYLSNYAGTYLRMGTGTNTPAVGNYELQTPVDSLTLITAGAAYSPSTGNVTFGGSITAGGTETITEVGTYMYGTQSNYYWLIFRDTFAGVSVVASDSVTFNYTLTLGTGFTDNFGVLLTAMLQRSTVGAATTMTFTDITGATFSTNVHGQSANNWLFDTDSSGVNTGLYIGTGSNAPARTDYHLQTPVETLFQTNAPTSEGSINVTVAGTTSVTADRTLYEAGFYTKGKDTSGTDRQILWFRRTFGATSVSSGRQVTVTFKVYFNV